MGSITGRSSKMSLRSAGVTKTRRGEKAAEIKPCQVKDYGKSLFFGSQFVGRKVQKQKQKNNAHVVICFPSYFLASLLKNEGPRKGDCS